MRALIVLAGATLLAMSAFAADTQVRNTSKPTTVTSVGAKHAKKASKSAKTEAPARVWTVEMSCCEPQ
jgi:hypothetical protein